MVGDDELGRNPKLADAPPLFPPPPPPLDLEDLLYDIGNAMLPRLKEVGVLVGGAPVRLLRGDLEDRWGCLLWEEAR